MKNHTFSNWPFSHFIMVQILKRVNFDLRKRLHIELFLCLRIILGYASLSSPFAFKQIYIIINKELIF